MLQRKFDLKYDNQLLISKTNTQETKVTFKDKRHNR